MNPVGLRRAMLKCCTGLALVALLSACGSSGNGTPTPSPSPSPSPTPTPTPAAPSVSFITSIQPIFNAHCIRCHALNESASLLVLNSGAYNNLVNRPSNAAGPNPTGTLVIPGNSAGSVLFQRVSKLGLSTDLLQMPLGGPFLSASDQNLIKTWIDEGAINN